MPQLDEFMEMYRQRLTRIDEKYRGKTDPNAESVQERRKKLPDFKNYLKPAGIAGAAGGILSILTLRASFPGVDNISLFVFGFLLGVLLVTAVYLIKREMCMRFNRNLVAECLDYRDMLEEEKTEERDRLKGALAAYKRSIQTCSSEFLRSCEEKRRKGIEDEACAWLKALWEKTVAEADERPHLKTVSPGLKYTVLNDRIDAQIQSERNADWEEAGSFRFRDHGMKSIPERILPVKKADGKEYSGQEKRSGYAHFLFNWSVDHIVGKDGRPGILPYPPGQEDRRAENRAKITEETDSKPFSEESVTLRYEAVNPCYLSLKKPFTAYIDLGERPDSETEKKARDLLLQACWQLLNTLDPIETPVFFFDGLTRNPGNWEFPSGGEFLLPLSGGVKKNEQGETEEYSGFVCFPRNGEEESFALDRLYRLNPENCYLPQTRKRTVGKEKHSDPRLVIACGYPDNLANETSRRLRRLLESNYRDQGVSLILVSSPVGRPDEEIRHRVDYTIELKPSASLHVRGQDKAIPLNIPRFTAKEPGREKMMRWIQEYQDAGAQNAPSFFSPELDLLPHKPPERREEDAEKCLSVPFAIVKESGEVFNAEFDVQDQPFAYYCAGTGGGKSSVLHMLIAGLLTRYHPDDLELWLLDLKGTEFSRYKDANAPHIRYILSSGSEARGARYVYDIIDRLHEEMESRYDKMQRAVGVTDFKNTIPREAYFPQILVIIDEFKVVDSLIGKNTKALRYANTLRDILARGRAAGINMIFASQTVDADAFGGFANAININTRIGSVSPNSDAGGKLFPNDMPHVKIGQKSLPRFHSIYTRLEGNGRTAYYLQHLFFKKEKDDLENVISSVNEMYQSFEPCGEEYYCQSEDGSLNVRRVPREQNRYVLKEGRMFIGNETIREFEKEGPCIPEENERFRRSQSKETDKVPLCVHVGKPCSFDRTRSIRLKKEKGENIFAIVSNPERVQTLVREMAAAALQTARGQMQRASCVLDRDASERKRQAAAEVDAAQVELWTSEENEDYIFGARKGLWKDVRCVLDGDIEARLQELQQAGRTVEERRLILILNLPELLNNLPNINSDIVEMLSKTIVSGPQNGRHFMVQVNSLNELQELAERWGDELPAFSLKQYRHLITGPINNSSLPYEDERQKLEKGLLLYSNQENANEAMVVYETFTF